MVVKIYNLETWEKIKDYDKEVVSIFSNENNNKLIQEIIKIKEKEKKIIADFGSGNGNSFKYLKDFKKVIAVDFSKNMLKKAIDKSKEINLKNINFIHSPLDKIKLDEKVDIIIAANSIFPSNYNDFDKIFQKILENLKKDGEIFIIMPSFESLTFFYQILSHFEFSFNNNIHNSIQLINKYIKDSNYSPFGYINTSLGMQKHWLKEEIEFRLSTYKLKKIEIDKLTLDWETQIKEKKLKKYPNLWYWFIKIKF